jgi:hypothetical protein
MRLSVLYEATFDFDHDDAVARIHAGETIRNIARSYNISHSIIIRWIRKAIRGGELNDGILDVIKQNQHDTNVSRARAQWKNNPTLKQKHRDLMLKRWEDPKFVKKHAAGLKKQWADPEFRAIQLQAIKKYWEGRDFWEWLAKYPLEKGMSIIAAMQHRRGNDVSKIMAMVGKLKKIKKGEA